MKTTSFIVAAFVACMLIGCSNSSNPVQTDQTSSSSLQRNGADDAALAAAARGGNNGETRIEGRVNAVDVAAGTVTIGSRVVQTNSATKIERNGFHSRLSDIRVGDRGQARIPAGASTASKVESVG